MDTFADAYARFCVSLKAIHQHVVVHRGARRLDRFFFFFFFFWFFFFLFFVVVVVVFTRLKTLAKRSCH